MFHLNEMNSNRMKELSGPLFQHMENFQYYMENYK